jgi:hypothetical protein
MYARVRLAAAGLVVLAFGLVCATHSVDFPVYHRAAVQLLHGDYELYPTTLYTGGSVPPHGFRYAPAIALLFVPFGLLPLAAAAFVFFALKAAALLYVSVVVDRHAGRPAPDRTRATIAVVVVGGYLVEEFRYGNFHFFCVALMVAAFDAAESGRVLAPAAALGVAIAAKLTPLLLVPYFALRRRFAVCAATVGTLVVLAVLPAPIVGFRMNTHLLSGFAQYALQKVGEDDNYSLRGVLFRYLAPTVGANVATALWLVLLVLGGLAMWAALRRRSPHRAIRLLEFSVVLTATLLASPHTQRRYFVALYVPVLALLALRGGARWSRGTVLIANAGIGATAVTGTVLPLVFAGRNLAFAYEATSPYFFGTLALFVALIVVTARLKTETQRVVT